MRTASLFAALALPLATAPVAAQEAEATVWWGYQYIGFQHLPSGDYLPSINVNGVFTGTDDNGDGTIDKSELDMLIFRSFDFTACGTYSYFTCSLDAFSFTPGQPLVLSASWGGDNGEGGTFGGSFTSGDRWRTFGDYSWGKWDDTYVWTANTVETVSIVPEPSALPMLAAGLAVIAGALPRRRRNATRIC